MKKHKSELKGNDNYQLEENVGVGRALTRRRENWDCGISIAKGFKQKEDIDFFDTFSLVTKVTSIILFIVIAVDDAENQ